MALTFFSLIAWSTPWKNSSATDWLRSETRIFSPPWIFTSTRLSFFSAASPGFFASKSIFFKSFSSVFAYFSWNSRKCFIRVAFWRRPSDHSSASARVFASSG